MNPGSRRHWLSPRAASAFLNMRHALCRKFVHCFRFNAVTQAFELLPSNGLRENGTAGGYRDCVSLAFHTAGDQLRTPVGVYFA